MSDYAQERARELTLLTRNALRELPAVCSDFVRAIEPTTQPLTRYAYVCDLKLFFHFLTSECPRFADKSIARITPDDLKRRHHPRSAHLYGVSGPLYERQRRDLQR